MRKYIKQSGFIVISIAVAIGLINLDSFVAATVPGTNQRVSITSTGGQANNSSGPSVISANGKAAAFFSSATNMLPSGGRGIFERNLATGLTVRINMSTAGTVDNGSSNPVVQRISATGRYVLFVSNGSNLIDGTTISSAQLYLRDTISSTTVLVSQTPSGAISNGTWLNSLGVSSDGRLVSFMSNASNLHPDSTDGTPHIYMLDRLDNTLSIIDRKTDGSVGVTNASWPPVGSMSCDGSFFAFQYPSNLIVGDSSSNHVDTYLLDRRNGANKLTNLTKTANTAVGPSISCNGDFVGFKSIATNLDPSVSVTYINNAWRPYVYDRVSGAFHFAAVTTGGVATNAAICGTIADGSPCVQLSDTGIGVFHASDSTLTGNASDQIYIRDIYANTTELISKNSSGVAGGGATDPSISADGRIVVYPSSATNLVSGDTNGVADVFTSLTGN